MGSVCKGQDRIFHKIEQYQHPQSVMYTYRRAEPHHSRFGNVQKIRTRKSDIYKLIMATNDVKLQTVSIQCRIMESTAQFQLYDGTKYQLQDKMISPIIDLFDRNNDQIYHPIKYPSNNLTLKSYPFSGFNDTVLKQAIYEIWIYNQMRSLSPLVDYFIMSRKKMNTIVLIFKNYQTSLLQLVRYRQLANFHWTEAELITLWKILINGYKNLRNMSICHREIRLSKIFYTSENRTIPFQFANLSTARKVSKQDIDDLLTVVGVDIFAQSPLNQKIASEQQLALYDPNAYDISCLIKLLLNLLNLNSIQNENQTCKNERLKPIIQSLKENPPNFALIQKDLDSILRSLIYQKNELFKEDKIISDHLIKSQLRQKNRQRIEDSYFETLLNLHKKDIFNRIVIEKMQQNENINKKYQNISILHKVGEYYRKIGLQKNQYFDQQFILLLDLAKQCRQQQFYDDHNEYITQLSHLLNLISRQKQLNLKYYNQLVYKFSNQNNLVNANQYLSNLLDLTYKYNDIPITLQIDILITKALLQIINKKYQVAQNTIQKINYIISNTTFDSQYDSKFYQAEIQYLKAQYEVSIMNDNKEEIKKKRIAAAESSISVALSLFTNLPQSNQNTVKIINAYLTKSDISNLKESYPQSKASLESADVLMAELQKTNSVSDNLRQKHLRRLKAVYQKSNKANEPIYKQITNKLAKIDKSFKESNAARHQRSKELRQKQRQKQKREMMLANSFAIKQVIQQDDV